MKTTQLARGPINHSDELLIELVEAPDMPPAIRLRWPERPTVCPPAQLDAVVAATMRTLANSVIELSAIRVWKKL